MSVLPPDPNDPLGPNTNRGSGVKMGKRTLFVTKDQIPLLDLHRVIEATYMVANGIDTYPHLVYLSRARDGDLSTVYEASRDIDVNERWRRLWVLCPVLARLARNKCAQTNLCELLAEDLAALHMFSKFDANLNPGVDRLFKRLNETLLPKVLDVLVNLRHDSTRSHLIAGIIVAIQPEARMVKSVLEEFQPESIVRELLDILPFSSEAYSKQKKGHGNLSTRSVGERLQSLAQKKNI